MQYPRSLPLSPLSLGRRAGGTAFVPADVRHLLTTLLASQSTLLAFHNRCEVPWKVHSIMGNRQAAEVPPRWARCLMILWVVREYLQVRVKLSCSGFGSVALHQQRQRRQRQLMYLLSAALPTQPKQTFKCSGKWQRQAATLGYIFSRSRRQHQLHTHTHTTHSHRHSHRHSHLHSFAVSIFTSSLPSTQKRQFCWLNAFERVARELERRAPHLQPHAHPNLNPG